MNIIAQILKLIAIAVTSLFAQQAKSAAADAAKTGQDDEGGIRG